MKIKYALITAFIIVLVWGCSSAGEKSKQVSLTPPPTSTKAPVEILPPEPPTEDIVDEDLPVMSLVDKKAPYLEFESRRQFSLSLQGSEIKDVLLAFFKDTDFGLVMDPGIMGNTPIMDVKNASLKEILSYILPPLHLNYKWEGKNLHIYKEPTVTRYFKLDYLSSTRKGDRQVSFSTRSNISGGGGGGTGGSGTTGSSSSGSMSGGGSGSYSGGSGGGGQNQSSSEISTTYENGVWKTFIESIKVLVFGSIDSANTAQVETSDRSSSNSRTAIKSFAFSDKSGKTLIVSPETGVIVVTAPEGQMDEIAQFIETYEGSAQRQVWIEARIIEVNLYNAYQMGIDWGTVMNRGGFTGILPYKRTISNPAFTFTPGSIEGQTFSTDTGSFQFAVSNGAVDIMLDAMSKQGNLKVLASPRISTLNNEKAVIRVVREEAFFNLQTQVSQGTGGNVTAPSINVQVVPIGIVMDIIPQIGENGDIMLSINPDISELLETRRFEVSGAMATQPVIDRRSLDTTAKLENGETLVIAGIIKERKDQVMKGVPFLYKLPLLGNLFRRTEQRIDRTELVILITPQIHSGKSAKQLTNEERQRIKDTIKPLRFGDAATIEEGLKGEIESFKKKEEKEQF